jgi:WD40 repeat protein
VWDVRAGSRNPVQVLQGHSRSVWSLKLAPASMGGDDTLLSAGNCGNVNIWDLRTAKVKEQNVLLCCVFTVFCLTTGALDDEL